jgi:rubrerythrin
MRRAFAVFAVASLLAATTYQKKNGDLVPVNDEAPVDNVTQVLDFSFAGEAMANQKYMAYAKVAVKEGYAGVAKLYKAAAVAESIHARNYMNLLGMIKTTKENLEQSIGGEQYEFTTMYPDYIKTAEDAGNKDAAQKLGWAFQVEKKHYNMFSDDLAMMNKGQSPAVADFWVCFTCGNTVMDKAPATCDVCGSPQDKFFEIK